MNKLLRYAVQVLTYAGFAAVIGYLSFWPQYQYAAPGNAAIKLSLSHATERVVPCVELTPQEVAKLPPNMRRTQSCERQRLPLLLQLDVDGERVYEIEAAPSGLWEDGPASVYERFELEPGSHAMTVRIRDTDRQDGWDYTHTEDVILEAGHYLTITFKAENGGFEFR